MTSQLLQYSGSEGSLNGSVSAPPSKKEVVLPEIIQKRDSEKSLIPVSGQNDFLPEEVLFSLTQPPQFTGAALPPSANYIKSVPKPSSVWNYPKRREKLKHLTDSTICTCGAGKDVSFLYDVPEAVKVIEKVNQSDPTAVREQTRRAQRKQKQDQEIQLPDSLVPAEFHVVKNKGVLGLEYDQSQYSTLPEDHEKHLVRFPSLKPTSRWEVLQLTQTFDKMLEKIGAGEDITVTGPTQMHRLLNLVKKEQDIYNIVFHEIVRQVTVECVERGELLATLRQRYNTLLSKVPIQVKSLHDEVMAQRALDRRLTEELLRFKTTISVLTSELSDVKEHDHLISDEARATQEELKRALEEAKRASDLVSEYHALYELQRHRLENQVLYLTEEKELWSQTAYSLSLKVIEEAALSTAKRLHISEKNWKQLASHFTIMLTEKDTEDLTRIQTLVDNWKDKVENFILILRRRDESTDRTFKKTKSKLEALREYFEDHHLSDENESTGLKLKKLITTSDMEVLLRYLSDLQSLLTTEAETFGGDTMLTHQETMASMKRLVLTWTDLSIILFSRHRQENGHEFPEKASMITVNGLVDNLMSQFLVRLTGENGIAKGIISLQNIIETWETRLKSCISLRKELPEQEWIRFYNLFDDWFSLIEQALSCIGSNVPDDISSNKVPTVVDPGAVVKEVSKWIGQTSSGIDSEDARLIESVNQLHSSMVRWMIQSLLRLAPDYPGSSVEAHHAALTSSATPEKLLDNYGNLIDYLSKFTCYASDSCSSIVYGIVQQKLELKEDDYDYEQLQLIEFKNEASEWCTAAGFILEELGIEPSQIPVSTFSIDLQRNPQKSFESQPTWEKQSVSTVKPMTTSQAKEGSNLTVTQREDTASDNFDIQSSKDVKTLADYPSVSETSGKAETSFASQDQKPAQTLQDEIVEGIGADMNIHSRSLTQSPDTSPVETVELEEGLRVSTPNAAQAFEALGALQQLQNQLQETELRAQSAEEKLEETEMNYRETLDREENLKAKIECLMKELEEAKAPPKPETKLPELLD